MGRRRRGLLGRKGKKGADSSKPATDEVPVDVTAADEPDGAPADEAPEGEVPLDSTPDAPEEEVLLDSIPDAPDAPVEPEVPAEEEPMHSSPFFSAPDDDASDSGGGEQGLGPFSGGVSESEKQDPLGPFATPASTDDYTDPPIPEAYSYDDPPLPDIEETLPELEPVYEQTDEQTYEETPDQPFDTTLPDEASPEEPLPGDPPAQDFGSAGMQGDDSGSDDAFMSDLYGAFGESPPTEEIPGGPYPDVAQPYNAPMNVPEPPQIPGISDRFTSPPVSHTDIGMRNPSRPSYLATPPPAPRQRQELPPTTSPTRNNWEDEEDERRGPRMGWVVALFGLFVVAFSGAGMGFLLFVGTTDGDGVRDEAPVVEEHEGVEVRGNMRQAPGAFGEVHEDDDESKTPAGTDEEEGDEEEGDDEGTDEEGDDEGTEEGSAAEEEPAPAPAPRPRPRPRAVPKPDPVPTAAPAAAKGTLKVRSNRRVLVYVNGAAIGYTPQDYKVSPGDYSVSASVPGQPGTKQTKDTSIAAAGATVAVEFNF